MTKRVAVIGVGASGLAAIHHVTAEVADVEVVGFERNDVVGGVWVYTDKTGLDEDGLPVMSSMYKNLRTNFPKDLMKFFDFPYKNPFPSFVGHEELKQYLWSYANHFKLHQYIKFKTIVTQVAPVNPESRDTKWEVTYCRTSDQSNKMTKVFDYVLVCNGHNAVPVIPKYPGLDNFRGKRLTSNEYRVPETFRGQRVVCVGSGPSATDLSADLCGVAAKVFTSMDKERCLLRFTVPEEAEIKPDIGHVTKDSVVFVNGEEEKVDVIITCSGYRYVFPFLDDSCKIVVKDNDQRVTPLYKHFVNIEYPTRFLLGIHDFSNNISVSDVQAQFASSVIAGRVTLPGKETMEQDTEKELAKFLESGMPSRHFHKLSYAQFDLMDSLLEMMGKPKLPKGYNALFAEVLRLYETASLTCRNLNMEITGDTYRIVPAK